MIGSPILSFVLGPNLRQRYRWVYIWRGWRSMHMLAEEIKRQLGRRSFLRKSGLAAGSAASMAALAPFSSLAQEGQSTPRGIPQGNSQAATATLSLSRQFARWVFGLRYDDLPPAVVDRAKGATLQAVTSALLGSQLPPGQEAVRLMLEEEAGVRNGATVMVNGAKVTKVARLLQTRK